MAPFDPHSNRDRRTPPRKTPARDVVLTVAVFILTVIVLTTFDPGPRDDAFSAPPAVEAAP